MEDPTICYAADFGGHYHILEYAKKEGSGTPDKMVGISTRLGFLKSLKGLHGIGCPLLPNTCALAALKGDLALLRWAREIGCSWDCAIRCDCCGTKFGPCECAATHGHLEVIQWARENGCPWDERVTFECAFRNSHSAVIDWMEKSGCPDYSLEFDNETDESDSETEETEMETVD